MGNRAVIVFVESPRVTPNLDDVAVYLHWNGGLASVAGFLAAASKLGVRQGDVAYAAARVVQIISNWFGGNLSIGLGSFGNVDADNGDNGVFVVDDSLAIVGRMFHRGEEEIDEVKSATIAAECVAQSQPFFAAKG